MIWNNGNFLYLFFHEKSQLFAVLNILMKEALKNVKIVLAIANCGSTRKAANYYF